MVDPSPLTRVEKQLTERISVYITVLKIRCMFYLKLKRMYLSTLLGRKRKYEKSWAIEGDPATVED